MATTHIHNEDYSQRHEALHSQHSVGETFCNALAYLAMFAFIAAAAVGIETYVGHVATAIVLWFAVVVSFVAFCNEISRPSYQGTRALGALIAAFIWPLEFIANVVDRHLR